MRSLGIVSYEIFLSKGSRMLISISSQNLSVTFSFFVEKMETRCQSLPLDPTWLKGLILLPQSESKHQEVHLLQKKKENSVEKARQTGRL